VRARAILVAVALVALVGAVAHAARTVDLRPHRLHLPPPARLLDEREAQPPPTVPPPSEESPGQPSGPPAPPPPSPSPPPPPPPPSPPPLPRIVAVDETEFAIALSRPTVGVGEVTFNVYNRGMDDHDLAVVDAGGSLQVVAVPPGETRTLVVQLNAGTVKLYCSLFGGTPQSHEDLGMVANIDVR
jgi:hypothetical protein